ncbi:MAG: hypothetical protein ACW98K_13820 [Candidatus Kariarchaeaceae archaeon]
MTLQDVYLYAREPTLMLRTALLSLVFFLTFFLTTQLLTSFIITLMVAVIVEAIIAGIRRQRGRPTAITPSQVSPLDDTKCPSCYAPRDPSSKYCEECGFQIPSE